MRISVRSSFMLVPSLILLTQLSKKFGRNCIVVSSTKSRDLIQAQDVPKRCEVFPPLSLVSTKLDSGLLLTYIREDTDTNASF